ncbi:MAG TPA: DICT sensory domain-containing protein [Solirubrobacteraceae bacterium]|nr:DICT sensory domain-containing protein [Solirubrobacteraceae bacterium]
MSRFEFGIGDFVARTGVTESTLRMWERRYGFPLPERTESGHRRYSEDQAELIDQVQILRHAGLSLPAAIARAQAPPDPEAISLFSSLRSLRPELERRVVSKPVLIAFSHAIEDEILARAEARVLFGCFQRETFYRSSQRRWRELSAAARVAAVFADFEQARAAAERYDPAEVPISRRQQIAREWAIVAYGGRSSVCMAGRELASSSVDAATSTRTFELVWTVDPEAVQKVGRACVTLLRRSLPELAAGAEQQLAVEMGSPAGEQVRLTSAVVGRVLSALS